MSVAAASLRMRPGQGWSPSSDLRFQARTARGTLVEVTLDVDGRRADVRVDGRSYRLLQPYDLRRQGPETTAFTGGAGKPMDHGGGETLKRVIVECGSDPPHIELSASNDRSIRLDITHTIQEDVLELLAPAAGEG